MYFTIYKITNKTNNKIYVGMHKTNNLNDSYMGSGKLLKRAITKYGIDNFTKEYLCVYDNIDDMISAETQIVNEVFVDRDDTYNLKLGGEGGNGLPTEHRTHTSEHMSMMRESYRHKLSNDEDFAKRISDTTRMNNIQSHASGERTISKNFTFAGKTHDDVTRQKISKSLAGRMTGDNNSQYGKMWIYNLQLKECKKINNTDYPQWETDGWCRGRKMKFE